MCSRAIASPIPESSTLHDLHANFLLRGWHVQHVFAPLLEIYLAHWQTGWLPSGVYHYDRRGHHLSQISTHADESHWKLLVPSLWQIDGGGLIWVLIGDLRRVAAKYGERGERFLLLEAGHLMQNLCLASDSLGLCTVPLGGCLEREIPQELSLPSEDRVLYVGVCGAPETGST